MKKMKKKNKSIGIKILLVCLTVLLALELLLLVWLQNADRKNDRWTEHLGQNQTTATGDTAQSTESAGSAGTEQENTVPTAQTDPTVEIVQSENGEVQTPYFTLYYPEGLADNLVVANTNPDPYTLEFYAMLEGKPEQRLFDIRLGENIQGNMGIVKTEGADISVDLILYKFVPDESWAEGEINTVLAMQEAANDMLGQLSMVKDPGSTSNPGIAESTPGSSVINLDTVKTPYCTLHIPAVWKDRIVAEQQENKDTGVYSVMFYGQVEGREKCLLFTVLFGGDEGEQVGALIQDDGKVITVNVLVEDLNLSGWTEEESKLLFSMQEAVNELIANLPLE